MNKMDVLVEEVEQLPEPMLDEVLEFVQFLKENPDLEWKETTVASGPPLTMEWLTPEEVKEWQKLWAAMW